MSELTGRRRFKRVEDDYDPGSWFLVLQVECTEFTAVAKGKPDRWVCMWRDATPEDVTEEVV